MNSPCQLAATVKKHLQLIQRDYQDFANADTNELCKEMARQSSEKVNEAIRLHKLLITNIMACENLKKTQNELEQKDKALQASMHGKEEAEEEARSIKRCSICLQNDKDTVLIPCSHTFCHTCVDRMKEMNGLCAYCRGMITENHRMHLTY